MDDGPAARACHVVDGLPVLATGGCLRLAAAGSQQRSQSGKAVGDDNAVCNQLRQRFFNLTAEQFSVLDDVAEERGAARLEIVVNHLRRRDRKSTRLNSSHSQISYA